MPWTDPSTSPWTSTHLVTAAEMVTYISNNLLWLGGTTGAITQIGSAVGVTSSPTTTSASNVDMTDMTVTLTTTLASDLLVWFWATYQCSTTAVLNVTVSYDGSDQSGSTPSISTSVGNIVVPYYTRVANTSAGVHVVKGRWATSAGTATAAGGQRQLLVLEVKR